VPAPVVPGPAGAPPQAAKVESTPPPTETPAPKDQRTGNPNRRKLPRRERGTLEQRTLNRTPPLEAPASESSPPSAAAAPSDTEEVKPLEAAATPAAASGQLRASGTIGARGELRSASREAPRSAESPSVVVDMGTAEPAAPVPAPAATGMSSRHATGVMQARPSTAQPAASSGFSIQVDPDLMAEMAAHEDARPTPPPVVAAPVLAPAPAPAPAAAKPSNGAPAAAKDLTPPPHAEAGKRNLRPSSEFDALERDFFAREADLYKQENAETFDDLDQGKGKGKGKIR
jgi:ribonuclease E